MTESQELAHRFNEEEAVWERYEARRKVRRLLGVNSLLTEGILDRLDWLEAERECREFRFIGRAIHLDRKGIRISDLKRC